MPRFLTQRNAIAWLTADAIAHATAPFREVLTDASLAELVDYLGDAAATHPHFRLLASRAAKTLLRPPRAKELAQAAKHDEPRTAVAPRPATPPALPEGAPQFDNPAFVEAARKVIEVHATRFHRKWQYPREDLIAIGWLVAVEIAPRSNAKSAFTTHLWRCVWRRFRDEVTRASHKNEVPFSAAWGDHTSSTDYAEDAAAPRFREAMDAAATSFVLGLSSDVSLDPETRLERFRDRAHLGAARAALPDRERTLLELVYDDGLTVEAASAKLGVSYATGRRAHGEALRTLHASLGKRSNVRALRPKASHAP